MGDLLCVGRSRGCERPQPKKRIQCPLALRVPQSTLCKSGRNVGQKQTKGNLEDHQSTQRPRGSLLAAQLVGFILRMSYPDCRALLGL